MREKKQIINQWLLNIFGLCIVAAGFFSCSQEIDEISLIFDVEPEVEIDIAFESIELDTFILDHIYSSYEGEIFIKNDSLIFFDNYYAKFFVFDILGNLRNEYMGIGPGPSEIPTGHLRFFDIDPDGGYVLIGSSNDYHVVNNLYERELSSVINWKQDKPISYLQRNPTPEDQRSYNLGYGQGHIRVIPGYLLLPLSSPEPVFSDFNLTTDLYAREGRIMAKMSIETGEVEEIFGRLSPLFIRNKDARIFSFFNYDIIEQDKIVITYRPDPNIYLFDLEFNILRIYGSPGRDMDENYRGFPSTSDVNILIQHWDNEIENRGYYTSIKFIDERGLLFRSYQKSGENDLHGLQIYRDNKLIADVDVPKNFKVTGYNKPYFYSNAHINEWDETITVYKFLLDESNH